MVPPMVLSTIRSTRSGWVCANFAVTQPPRDSPVKYAFSAPNVSRTWVTWSM